MALAGAVHHERTVSSVEPPPDVLTARLRRLGLVAVLAMVTLTVFSYALAQYSPREVRQPGEVELLATWIEALPFGQQARLVLTEVASGPMHSVLQGNLHYIVNGDGTEDLYDLSMDPDEKSNLSHQPAQETAILWFREYLAQVPFETLDLVPARSADHVSRSRAVTNRSLDGAAATALPGTVPVELEPTNRRNAE